ncbi:hypothetical protein PENSPDRAFT_684880 [Peniophora sp. CONT]|nr:hypothetical protein PENSPDRAFT_684880 [Peniophora sp. CONT]
MDLGFIRASHTCRQWRRLLLSLSSLWSRHVFTFPQPAAVLAILERTRAAPLHMDRLYLRPQSLELLHEILPRTTTLDLSTQRSAVSLDGFTDVVRSLCTQAAPQLEYAKLVYEPLNGALLLSGSGASNQPPMSAPRLQRLTLINTFFPFELPSLTHLKLSWQPKPDARLPAASLLAGLRASPQLRSVEMSHSLSDGLLDESVATTPRISLPHLTHFAVKDEARLVFALAGLIVGSPELHLEAELVDDSPGGTAALEGLSHQFRRILAYGQSTALSISHADYFLKLKFLPIPPETPLHAAHATSPPLGGMQWQTRPAGPGLVATFSGRAWDQFADGEPGTTFRRLLRGAVRDLRAHERQVRALELLPRASAEPCATEWVECLAPFDSLRTLACAPAEELMGALADAEPELFLPRLAYLAVDVGEVMPGLQATRRSRAQAEEVRVLCAVEARAEAGYPLKRVRVEGDMDAQVLESLLARLRINVPYVEHFSNSTVQA